MPQAKQLLIVYHSQSGKTHTLARAVHQGALSEEVSAVDCRMLSAARAGPRDMFEADGVIFGTPENFGYMSGAMKDFFDRSFYPCEGKLEGLPFALFVGAGNDGRGAVSSVRKIAKGWSMKEVQEPLVVNQAITPEDIRACETLGLTLAAGLEMGIF